jgi:uncharacterized membrane protein YeaQ/YmgE (transglycosylase-associated protein family)
MILLDVMRNIARTSKSNNLDKTIILYYNIFYKSFFFLRESLYPSMRKSIHKLCCTGHIYNSETVTIQRFDHINYIIVLTHNESGLAYYYHASTNKKDANMNIIIWLVFGGIAGWIASMFAATTARQGMIGNIVIGIIGSFLGGFIFSLFGASGVTGFNLYSFLVAITGSVVLLRIYTILTGHKRV